ncbi:MAG: POTRA domain-containing protein [Bacteroidota bacterium]
MWSTGRGFLFVLVLLISGEAVGEHWTRPSQDTTGVVTIGRILIAGNAITRDRIILRELSLVTGDTISRSRLAQVLEANRMRIYNLRIFNRVTIEPLELTPGNIDLLVEVQERWYTYPVPLFELSDRNFNDWWQNYNHDLSRVNYGLRLYQYNFRGRNETLRLTARFGFSRRFDLYYHIPNLTKDQKHGLLFKVEYAEPSNLAYRTEDHVLTFLTERKPLRTSTGASVTYSFRKSFYQTHYLDLSWDDYRISDTIRSLNPGYFIDGRYTQQASTISYRFVAEHRDVIAYPLHGYQVSAGLMRSGLFKGDQVNLTNIWFNVATHHEPAKDLYLSFFASASATFPAAQPYALFNGIGYRKQFLRGYEIYVIEGPVFTLNKATLKKRIFHRDYVLQGAPLEQMRYLPLSIYLKTYTDLGYVQNYPSYKSEGINDRLSGKLLAGAGVGIDIVTYYDSVIRFEYSVTNQKTSGFFFHVRKEF